MLASPRSHSLCSNCLDDRQERSEGTDGLAYHEGARPASGEVRMLIRRMRLALPAQIVLALSLRCQAPTRAANGSAPARAANDGTPAASASVASHKPVSPDDALIARAKSLRITALA